MGGIEGNGVEEVGGLERFREVGGVRGPGGAAERKVGAVRGVGRVGGVGRLEEFMTRTLREVPAIGVFDGVRGSGGVG